MKKLLFLLLLIAPILLFGQEEAQLKTDETPEVKKGSSYVTFGVSPFLFLISPRWSFGYIQNIDDKIKIGVNLGVGASNIIFDTYNDNFSDYFLWEVRPEIYIIHNPKSKISLYNSIELFYVNENAVIEDSYYLTENDLSVDFLKADYNRQKLGVVANFGAFFPFSSHFGMNVYAGLGVKWRLNNYSNVIQAEIGPNYEDFFWRSYYRKEGLKFGFQPNFGINLNLIIK